MPRIHAREGSESRLGVGAADQQSLLHALDLGWLYLVYAGVPVAPVAAAAMILLLLTGFAAWRTFSACRNEAAVP